MVEQFGNSIPAPGVSPTWKTGPNIEILYSAKGWTQKGVALAPGQGTLLAGTLLVQDDATKSYKKWTGSGKANGILRQTTDTGVASAGFEKEPIWNQNIVVMGMVQLPKIIRANSGATASSLEGAFGGSRADAVQGFFKF